MPEIRSVIKNRGSKKFAFISQDCSWVAVEELSSERKWKVKSKAEKTGNWRASPGVGAVLRQVTDQPVTKYRLNTWAVQDAVQWFKQGVWSVSKYGFARFHICAPRGYFLNAQGWSARLITHCHDAGHAMMREGSPLTNLCSRRQVNRC